MAGNLVVGPWAGSPATREESASSTHAGVLLRRRFEDPHAFLAAEIRTVAATARQSAQRLELAGDPTSARAMTRAAEFLEDTACKADATGAMV